MSRCDRGRLDDFPSSPAREGRRRRDGHRVKKALDLAADDPYILYGIVCIFACICRVDDARRFFIRAHPRFQALIAQLS
jgi:hypothetical protein